RSYNFGGTLDPNDVEKILSLADRSIALNPNDMMAYIAKAYYMAHNDRWNDMLRVANAGLAINSSAAALLAARGFAENKLGRYDDGASDIQQARKLSPHDPDVMVFAVGW